MHSSGVRLGSPAAHGTICAIRATVSLLNAVEAFATRHRTLVMNEILFPSVALQAGLRVTCPIKEFAALEHNNREDNIIHWEEVRPGFLYHPLKDPELRRRYRDFSAQLQQRAHELVIHTTTREEPHVFLEWVAHHLVNIGVDRIVIYDDTATGSLPEELAAALPVTLRDRVHTVRVGAAYDQPEAFRRCGGVYDADLYEREPRPLKQIYMMWHFVRTWRHRARWAAFMDCDEFLWLREGLTLRGYLDALETEDPDLDGVRMPWLIYGTSFHVDQPPRRYLVMDAFRRHAPSCCCSLSKTCALLERITEVTCSHNVSQRLNVREPDQTELLLCHYNKMAARLFLNRKSLLSTVYGYPRSPGEILKMLTLSDNDAAIYDERRMARYAEALRPLLGREPYVAPADAATEEQRLAPCAFWHHGQLVMYDAAQSEQSTSLTQLVNAMIQDPSLRYATWSELLPADFSVNDYRALHADLTGLSDLDIRLHYVSAGAREGRLYRIVLPSGFDPAVYRQLNPDLAGLADGTVSLHYMNAGAREGRRYALESDSVMPASGP
jgi:hypothetical protein